jgi:hypothetical protein
VPRCTRVSAVRAQMGCQLNRYWQGDRRADGRYDVSIEHHNIAAATEDWSGHDAYSARWLRRWPVDMLLLLDPAGLGRSIQAGGDGNRNHLLALRRAISRYRSAAVGQQHNPSGRSRRTPPHEPPGAPPQPRSAPGARMAARSCRRRVFQRRLSRSARLQLQALRRFCARWNRECI